MQVSRYQPGTADVNDSSEVRQSRVVGGAVGAGVEEERAQLGQRLVEKQEVSGSGGRRLVVGAGGRGERVQGEGGKGGEEKH